MPALDVVAARIPAGTWTIDPDHSHVEFAVRHLGFTTVKGRVGVFDGTLSGGDEPRLEGTLDMATVTTFAPDRDGHLRSADFFDVERHPRARFVSTAIEEDGDGLVVRGDLTLRGVTRPVALRGRIAGEGEDPWGNRRVGLDLAGTIDRREWGMSWNLPIPGGGVLVENDVRLSAAFSLLPGD